MGRAALRAAEIATAAQLGQSPALCMRKSSASGLALLVALSLATHSPRALGEGDAAVELAGQRIPPVAIERALASCAGLAEEATICLERRWLPAFRLAKSGEDLHLEQSPGFVRKRAHLLLDRLFEVLLTETPPPSEAVLTSFYAEHHYEFEKPERFRLFRILVDSEAEASALLQKLPAVVQLETWRALAREHSRDRATHQRGGDLGYVSPDGSTDVPEVRVEAGLYAAAQSLADGELLRRPVPEGERFALLWRRGSLAAVSRPLPEVKEQLSARLRHASAQEQLEGLVQAGRSRDLHDYAPEKLALYEEAQKTASK